MEGLEAGASGVEAGEEGRDDGGTLRVLDLDDGIDDDVQAVALDLLHIGDRALQLPRDAAMGPLVDLGLVAAALPASH